MKSHRPRKTPLFPAILLCILAVSAHAADKKLPAAKPAAQYAAFDTHAKEHVTVAAEPCDDPKACSFFRLPYIQHGFLPNRVIFTNDSDAALSLDDARIQFISAENDKIPAATDEDLDRRLFSLKGAAGHKIPLPLPLPPITVHDKPVDKKITQDENDFGFTSTTVQPHATLAGYLFYDVRELTDPLKDAQLYVKMVHTVDNKTQLFDFNVPFNKWLTAHPGASK